MDDMLETMYHNHGVGLAAPQVAVSKRIIVLDLSKVDIKEDNINQQRI
ncbi:polypeptide deformylase family protein [Orientia tsutsugamushi str. Gilliam]|uniref:Polypeptide deformylase family protein n=1 Tax=Orientia tsutsugamushi str. Gilliam TaxID=1359184 RepID=A0A0F3M6M5_ORITS|nr:polypeptide deformylase family protein [Orientia tsutsugamushi str. Gilliam]